MSKIIEKRIIIDLSNNLYYNTKSLFYKYLRKKMRKRKEFSIFPIKIQNFPFLVREDAIQGGIDIPIVGICSITSYGSCAEFLSCSRVNDFIIPLELVKKQTEELFPIQPFPLEVLKIPEIENVQIERISFPKNKDKNGIDRGHKRNFLQRKIMQK